jgi:DNA-binding NarL/FixJ family response regulator
VGEDGVGGGAGALRLLVVDDDEWVRRGRVAALQERGVLASVVGRDHRGALDEPAVWDDVDVALVDAHDPDAPWDRFPGVAVVQAARRRRPDGLRIIVITGHDGNELLRRRMADAGADWFFAHRAVRNVEDLLNAVVDPVRFGTVLETQYSGLNDALDLIDARGFHDAFEPGRPQKASSASRRQLITLRSHLSRVLKFGGNAPLRRIAAVVNEARGVYDSDRNA